MIRRLLAALGLAVALTIATPSAPAQAYGWSGQRCDVFSIGRVCIQLHTIPSGSGLKVDQTQLCAYQTGGKGFRDVHDSALQFWGSGGNYLGSIGLNGTDASPGGTCSYTNSSFQMGNQACYHAYGRRNEPLSDPYFSIDGRVLGGAC